MKTDNVLIIIPTYNEAPTISDLIRRIVSVCPCVHVLVVDDNSSDGTGRIVQNLVVQDSRVAVLNRCRKGGLGTAYKAGMQFALRQDPPYAKIVQMDGDFSHSPENLPALLSLPDGCDIAVGSRYVLGARIAGWDFFRRLVSCCANAFVRQLLGKALTDWTSGFRCFSRKALAGIDFSHIRSDGYFFQVELLNACIRSGNRCAEIPIVFCGRKAGCSKMGLGEVASAFWSALRLGFSNRREK